MKKGKKAPAAVSAAKGKKGKKAVEEPEEEPETDPAKYLQINKRGKAGEKEAEFNAEFNQVRSTSCSSAARVKIWTFRPA